jgi:hypothetical protein
MLLRSCHSRLSNVFALNSFGRLRPLSTVPVKKHPEFVVSARSESGSRRSRRLRDGKHRSKGEFFYFYNSLFFVAHVIPGVFYGIDDDKNVIKINIQINGDQLQNELKSRGSTFENIVYDLVVKGGDGSEVARYPAVARNTAFASCEFDSYFQSFFLCRDSPWFPFFNK